MKKEEGDGYRTKDSVAEFFLQNDGVLWFWFDILPESE